MARLAALCAALLAAGSALTSARAGTASSGNGPVPRTASTDLAFTVSIDAFLFFRIGDGLFPTPGGTVSNVSFALTPAIPGGPATPSVGNKQAATWNGAAPAPPFTVTPTNNVLPVEVRSNAGQVSLLAAATTPLMSGANNIPLSEITIATSDATLPAPLIPNTGTSAAVNVTGGGTGTTTNLVTLRTANWTFSYANAISRPAGAYSGQVTFTASTP